MLSGGLGGVQAAFANYTALLSHLGHETICCVSPDALIQTHLPPSTHIVTLANKFEHDPLAIYRAVRLLKTHKPDVVLVHGKRALVIFGAARKLAGVSVPLVNVLHRHRFKRVNLADMSICVSRRLCDEAVQHGINRRKLAFVPNFIPNLWPTMPVRTFRDPPTIGFVGRMLPEKGLDLLIEAARLLKDQGYVFKMRLGGDGELKGALMALAEQRGLAEDLTWLGWIEDVPAFYEAVDICCVPSRWESFGIVVLHAFNAGKAVVATRTVGPSEIITDQYNGLLCDISPEDIAAKLKLLLDDPGLAFKLATKSHADRNVYTMQAVAPQVDAILRNAVSEMVREAAVSASDAANDVAS